MIAVGIVYVLKKRKSSTYSPNKHQEKSLSILQDGETKTHSSGTFYSNPLYDEIYSNESSFGSFRAAGGNLEEGKIVDIVQE